MSATTLKILTILLSCLVLIVISGWIYVWFTTSPHSRQTYEIVYSVFGVIFAVFTIISAAIESICLLRVSLSYAMMLFINALIYVISYFIDRLMINAVLAVVYCIIFGCVLVVLQCYIASLVREAKDNA